MNRKAVLASVLAAITLSTCLTGCSFSLTGNSKNGGLTEELQSLRDKGIIAYEESTLGIKVDTEDITSKLVSGQYYVLHENTLYPCYTQEITFSENELIVEKPDPKNRFCIVSSETVINIPTLFEGDKLYYYSEEGILNFTTLERFKDLGWSIGINKLKVTPGGYAYIDFDKDESYSLCLHNSLKGLDKYTDTTLLVDQIGGVRVTENFVEDGIITQLSEGATYDLAVYNGTNYIYVSANVDTRYFQSMEVYALAEYYTLQDYLYEITIPDYLLDGYYYVNGTGLMRLTRGSQYDEGTEFNEALLCQYKHHVEGDDTEKGTVIPFRYSETASLNNYTAWDDTCFGYVDKNHVEEKEEANADAIANFITASKTATKLWLPSGRDCVIEIVSSESTGDIYLQLSDGRLKKVAYDRIGQCYRLNIKGSGEIANLIVQGLYSDYTIRLTNAESYKNQDTIVTETTEEKE